LRPLRRDWLRCWRCFSCTSSKLTLPALLAERHLFRGARPDQTEIRRLQDDVRMLQTGTGGRADPLLVERLDGQRLSPGLRLPRAA
jgi:hypothetical protein